LVLIQISSCEESRNEEAVEDKIDILNSDAVANKERLNLMFATVRTPYTRLLNFHDVIAIDT